jgi:hypothetical protein
VLLYVHLRKGLLKISQPRMKHGWNTDKKEGSLPQLIQKVMFSESLYLCMCFPCRPAYQLIEFQSVFHPWLKDVLLY